MLRLGDAHFVNWHSDGSGGKYRPAGFIANVIVYLSVGIVPLASIVAVAIPDVSTA